MKKIDTKKLVGKAAFCALLGLTLSGCASSVQPEHAKESSAMQEDNRKELVAVAQAEFPSEPEFKTEDDQWNYSMERREKLTEEFTSAYQAFAMKTSAELLKDSSENIAYSPLSLYYALALACDGADGATQEEILRLLGYENIESLETDCKGAFEALYYVPNEKNNKPNEWGEYPSESRYTLMIANSLWADDSMELDPTYAERAAKLFYADIFRGDLQAEETAKKKAEWVREKTKGLIEASEQPLLDNAQLSIVNTVYFYDEWMNRFQKEETKEDSFTLADGTEVTCEFMNMIRSSAGFRRGENYTASSLSLKNGNMVFVLPDEGVDVNTLAEDEATLSEVLFDGGESLFGRVTWKVPKFSYGSDMELADALKTLGMKDAFTSDADFSSMSESAQVFISDIRQNAHIGIDENGVEAAAFTEILFAGAALPKDEAEMILDRPFLYAVINNGQIVFTGICEDPTKE